MTANIIASLALIASIVSVVVAWKARGDSRTSAQIAKDALKDGRAARHDSCRPPQPTNPDFAAEPDALGGETLYFSFTLPRSYRMAVDGLSAAGVRTSRKPLVTSQFVAAGEPIRVPVGTLTGGKGVPLPDILNVRFWPPRADDPGEKWTCMCGQPTDPSEHLHWEWNVPVDKSMDYDIRDSLG